MSVTSMRHVLLPGWDKQGNRSQGDCKADQQHDQQARLRYPGIPCLKTSQYENQECQRGSQNGGLVHSFLFLFEGYTLKSIASLLISFPISDFFFEIYFFSSKFFPAQKSETATRKGCLPAFFPTFS